MTLMNLGQVVHIAIGDYGKVGRGYIGEDLTTFEDACEAVSEFLKDDDTLDFRVLRVDLTVKPNLPECTTDVTEEVRDILIERGAILTGEPGDDTEHERQERHGWEQV